jgi:hypothetical protein
LIDEDAQCNDVGRKRLLTDYSEKTVVDIGMIRGAVGTGEEEQKKKTTIEEERGEDELEEEILLEIFQEGRGEREKQGERDEWNQHVGWHRKEDVGLKPQEQPHSRHRHEQNRPAFSDNDDRTEKHSDSMLGKTDADADLPRDKSNHGHARDRNRSRPPSLRNRRYGAETIPLPASSVSQGGVVVWVILAVAAVCFGCLLLRVRGNSIRRRNNKPSRRRGFGRQKTKGRTL